MLIRCQSCQALFSLQDGVAAAGVHFKVECGRCQSVFETTAPVRVPERAVTPAPQRPIEPPRKPVDPGVVERPVSGGELAKALSKPAPAPKRGRWPWIVLSLAVAVAAGLVLYARFAGLPRRAQERIVKARELLLRDDAKSLEQATALFTEAARIAPGEAAPEGERAFALLLQAAADKDLAGRVPKEEAEPLSRSATRRLQEGLAAAKAALEDDREEPAALRAIALHAALTGAPDPAQPSLEKAEKAAPRDAWIPWTRAALALSGPAAHEKQDRALAALAVARQREPRLLRAQVDVAAISIDRQEPGPARDVLAKVLAANPAHERARRLLALLPAAP